jgi:hypothetical protein
MLSHKISKIIKTNRMLFSKLKSCPTTIKMKKQQHKKFLSWKIVYMIYTGIFRKILIRVKDKQELQYYVKLW